LLTKKLAEKAGIFALTGAEVNTREEVHCLVFFDGEERLNWFQNYIEENINRIPNPDGHFGYQPVVDEHDNILELVPYYLHASLKTGISQLQKIVHEKGGIIIPSHVDRPVNGLFSQLGFFPPDLEPDALEISKHTNRKHVEKHHVMPVNMTYIRNSDAHSLQQIGEICTVYNIDRPCFSEIKMALQNLENRTVEIE
jgi:PHP family Zn ribbon phosphoesterase